MATLRAATDELLSAANGWHGMAGELLTTPPTVAGVSGQASAAAVHAVHAGVLAAGDAFAARTQVTAVKTAAASFAYTENDATSTDLLAAITKSL